MVALDPGVSTKEKALQGRHSKDRDNIVTISHLPGLAELVCHFFVLLCVIKLPISHCAPLLSKAMSSLPVLSKDEECKPVTPAIYQRTCIKLMR